MAFKLLVSLLWFDVVASLQTLTSEDFYNAAVVEYNPVKGKDSKETLLLNVDNFVNIINEATNYADIVVFPEASLLHGDMNFFVKIPFGNNTKAPADDDTLHPALQKLSQAARNGSIYVVINIHEEYESMNETYFYNTNVVFNRNGSIVARYRKYNLFSEVKFLNITKNPEHSYFDADFGVRFGLFTCFDILFRDPALKLKNYNVTDYIFPTWWFSELPYLTAIQQQAGWAYATDSNLLASGGNNVGVGSSGSGIYAGKKGPIVYIQSNYNRTTLLTAKVYKRGKNGASLGVMRDLSNQTEGVLKMKTDISLKYYLTSHLTPELNIQNFLKNNLSQNFLVEKEHCQGSFCCYYSINMTVIYKNITGNVSKNATNLDQFNNYEYKLATFNGVRSFDGFATGGIQVCSIISCLNKSLSSCGKTKSEIPGNFSNLTSGQFKTIFNNIIIKTTTLDKEAFAEPTILEFSEHQVMFGSLMDIDQFTFDHTGATSELRLHSQKLYTAGILARIFSRDGSKPGTKSSSTCLQFFIALLVLPLLLVSI